MFDGIKFKTYIMDEVGQNPLFIKKEALRFNENKPRYDLLEPHAIHELVKVFTKGSEKYADRNWEKGMKWSKMLASLKRHLAAFEQGEDYDKESNLNHMAHVAWNALGLVTYMRTHPELDDRQHTYLKVPKIGLDIDDVIANWTPAWAEHYQLKQPTSWSFSYKNKERFDNGGLEEFYKNLKPKVNPLDIPFEPHCYITARSIDVKLTERWIEENGFPTAPVYSVPFGGCKVEAAKASGLEWFIDDSYKNFVELNNAGICTFLMSMPHNERYNVGYKRIKDFNDFKNRFLC